MCTFTLSFKLFEGDKSVPGSARCVGQGQPYHCSSGGKDHLGMFAFPCYHHGMFAFPCYHLGMFAFHYYLYLLFVVILNIKTLIDVIELAFI